MDDNNVEQGPVDDPHEQLTDTAEAWRVGMTDTDTEESADEVAAGADNATQQPGFGREGQ